jgi:hypothetical protein
MIYESVQNLNGSERVGGLHLSVEAQPPRTFNAPTILQDAGQKKVTKTSVHDAKSKANLLTGVRK